MNPSLTDLAKKAGKCGKPRSYWAFRPGGVPWIPQNILCFCHQSASNIKSANSSPRVSHHHRFVLVCALEADGEVCVDAENITLRRGEALLIQPFQFHYFLRFSQDDIRWFFVTFEPDDEAKLEGFRNAGPRVLEREGMIILDGLIESWLGRRQTNGLALHLSLLVSYLLDGASGARTTSSSLSAMSRGDDELLRRINGFAQARRHQQFSIEEIGSAFGMSANTLRARFKEATGLTLGKHLRELHIQHACSLLYRKDSRIAEVAETCGFASESAFSRAFKTARGVSPREYRDGAGSR